MTHKSHSRRKLLKSIAAGSGAIVTGKSLPESWSKPVVDSILLPAHAETTSLACCAGVFCNLGFNENWIIGSAQVNSDCTITIQGDSEGGVWSGSGTVAADGSFSFQVSGFPTDPNVTGAIVVGAVTADCLRISGKIDITTIEAIFTSNFSGSVTEGATSIDQCALPI